jgi:MATE family multidrug resistance protein
MLVTFLSFAIDIPLSIGGVAVVVLCVRGANLEDVYLYQVAAAVVELMIAYVFIFKSDWRKLSEEALARQTAR